MYKTLSIILATAVLILATLIPTFVLNRRKQTSGEDWAIANRELPLFVVVGTQFASVFGGGIMVGHLGNTYQNGISVIFYGIFMVLPFVFLALIAKWLRKNEFATIPDILKKYSNRNKTITVLSSAMTMLFPLGWITSQITAFGSIYSALTGLDYTALCIIFSLISLFFIMPAGLKTVAWTDFFFACFMGIILIISLGYGTNMAGGVNTVKATVDPDMYEVITNAVSAYTGIKGQKTMRTRYLMEDIPYSLVALQTMGQVAGVPTPCISAVITVARAIIPEMDEGRTRKNLGLEGVDKEAFEAMCREG